MFWLDSPLAGILLVSFFFFFNDTATTEIYTLSLHDALPIWFPAQMAALGALFDELTLVIVRGRPMTGGMPLPRHARSEEHTSELQSRLHLVCRLLLEKKKRDSAGARFSGSARRPAARRRPRC